MRKRVLLFFLLLFLCGCRVASGESDVKQEKDNIKTDSILMPKVIGMDMYEAFELLKDNGINNVISNADDETYFWTVEFQSIPAGKEINRNEEIRLGCKKNCNVILDLKSDNNLLFSRYDVEILFDQKSLGVVANGEAWSISLETTDGTHRLTFRQKDNTSKNIDVSLEITGDAKYSCSISHGKSIEAKNEVLIISEKGPAVHVPDVTGLLYVEASNQLKSLGLVGSIFCDGGVEDETKEIVVSQSIVAGKYVNCYEEITLQCVDYVDSLLENCIGANLENAVSYLHSERAVVSAVSELNGEEIALEQNTDSVDYSEWVVSNLAYSYDGVKKVNLLVSYEGESVIPDGIIGMDVINAVSTLKGNLFGNISVEPELNLEDLGIWQWYITGLNYESGNEVNTKEQIILTAERHVKTMNFKNVGKSSYSLFNGKTVNIVFAISPDDVELREWDVIIPVGSSVSILNKRVYSEGSKNYISFTAKGVSAGESSLKIKSAYDEESSEIKLTVKDYKISSLAVWGQSGYSLRVGETMNHSFPVRGKGITWKDIEFNLSNRSAVSITKGKIEKNGDLYTLHFSVEGKKKGETKLTISTAEGNLKTDSLNIEIKPKGTIVYVTPSGDCYHYSAKCAGKNAHAVYKDETNKRPCGKCVH